MEANRTIKKYKKLIFGGKSFVNTGKWHCQKDDCRV